MALELGLFHNGATDLPTKVVDEVVVPDGTLSELAESYARVQQSQVRQGVLADQLGFDYLFMTEHHFQPEGAEFSPNPLLTEMAIAALTKRIRLAQGANVLTQHHPVRVAEQAAMLDIISGGRLEFGIARGYQPREVETLGGVLGSTTQDQERNRAFFEEAYEIVLKCWTEDSFSHCGEFFSLPPKYTRWHHRQTMAYFTDPSVGRQLEDVLKVAGDDSYATSSMPISAKETTLREIQVFPKPLQKPYPQVWQPLTSPRSVRYAAERGVNGYFSGSPASRLRLGLEAYYETAENAGFPDRLDRGRFKFGWDSERRRGVISERMIHIADHGIGDLERAARGIESQWDFYVPFGFAAVLNEPDEPPLPPNAKVTAEQLLERGVAIHGSVDHVIEEILKMKEVAGYEEDFFLNCHFELAGFSGEEIEEQMHCFAEHVAPALAAECGGRVDHPESTVRLTPQPTSMTEVSSSA
jgi:alkanesulfonate monooxygenase SsuD/methylene tetrahydromethanopterin reductase-like flavin-dependent oxidoreductase (luciferase family)